MSELKTIFDEVKDSGKRQEFTTGARRDTQENKPRYDLIPLHPMLRLAMHYTNGAVKYGEHNWTKGMELSRFYASMFRHMLQWAEGDRTEDHLAAVAWNAFALMHFEGKGNKAPDGTDLDDMALLRGDTTPELQAAPHEVNPTTVEEYKQFLADFRENERCSPSAPEREANDRLLATITPDELIEDYQ